MKNNAQVGGEITLDVCKVPAFAWGPPPQGSRRHVHNVAGKLKRMLKLVKILILTHNNV